MDSFDTERLQWLRTAPLLQALDYCLAELRTPLTAVAGSAAIIRVFTTHPDSLALARTIQHHCAQITDQHINDAFLDLRRHLLARCPELNAQHWYDDIGMPLRPSVAPLATLLSDIIQHLRADGAAIANTLEQLQAVCASVPNPDIATIAISSQQRIAQFLVAVDVLESIVVERLQQE
jgi:signal transduction histidine kinase